MTHTQSGREAERERERATDGQGQNDRERERQARYEARARVNHANERAVDSPGSGMNETNERR